MLTTLYELIGRKVVHNDRQCILIEVIEEGPHLVFQCQSGTEIQCDQHGSARRRSLPTYTIHCLNEQKTDLHPVVQELLNDQQKQQLLNALQELLE